MTAIAFTILGEAASKANSREIVTRRWFDDDGDPRHRPLVRKSDKALRYEASALRQIPPPCRARLAGPVRVTLRMYYASERPDLDESLLLDVLQDRWVSVKVGGVRVRELAQRGVIRNDRQVREKHVFHAIDRLNPRVEIVVEPFTEER
ncbi:Holliday junction resolvase RusA-like endonuclease [Paraburkholderia sp. GAS448]|uniref:hypothetical protein n=1 Tax=Paraburkholderia sp. GAS448 TaxID=3035136 RepID=UPI003D1C808C